MKPFSSFYASTLRSNSVLIAAAEIHGYILIDNLGSKNPTLQAASQVSLIGHALILGAVIGNHLLTLQGIASSPLRPLTSVLLP